jgi:hypothetical protein
MAGSVRQAMFFFAPKKDHFPSWFLQLTLDKFPKLDIMEAIEDREHVDQDE